MPLRLDLPNPLNLRTPFMVAFWRLRSEIVAACSGVRSGLRRWFYWIRGAGATVLRSLRCKMIHMRVRGYGKVGVACVAVRSIIIFINKIRGLKATLRATPVLRGGYGAVSLVKVNKIMGVYSCLV